MRKLKSKDVKLSFGNVSLCVWDLCIFCHILFFSGYSLVVSLFRIPIFWTVAIRVLKSILWERSLPPWEVSWKWMPHYKFLGHFLGHYMKCFLIHSMSSHYCLSILCLILGNIFTEERSKWRDFRHAKKIPIYLLYLPCLLVNFWNSSSLELITSLIPAKIKISLVCATVKAVSSHFYYEWF